MFPYVALFSFLFFITACSKHKEGELRVGVTNGPHAIIAEHVQKLAEAKGIKVKLIAFDEFIQPNVALDAGDIDLNIYQHEPFLHEQMQSRGYAFASLGKAIILPLGIYGADHVKSLKDIPRGAKALIPVDPTNSSRALKLLEAAGLIKLSNHINPMPKDLAQNALELKIIEVEAPLLPRLLKDDADIAVINADWVMVSGIDPNRALFKEGTDSPYANLFVVKQGREGDHNIQNFIALYQSDDVKQFIQKQFKGAILPAAWKG